MNQPAKTPQDISRLLRQWSDGDHAALEELLPLVYEELHRQAARYLRRERAGHTLQTTALIHEAYLRLIDQRDVQWESRTHFFAIAAQMMRRVLVDYGRAKHREKRGGNDVQLPIEVVTLVADEGNGIDLIELDEALTRLAKMDQQQARVVELRYFGGLSLEETAEALRFSRATVARDWDVAKAWLRREMSR
jgi:RNA polymerase sigma factor (TIGR02999 family)